MTKQEQKKWFKLVADRKAWCYIKKNRKKHDSGYGCFEVGYMTIEKQRMKDKIILGDYTDHIWFSESINKFSASRINIDVTLDGYIRFHSQEIIKWDCDNFGLSTMGFEIL